MAFGLNRIGQIALGVQDVDRAEEFYRDALGLRLLYRFGDLTFFDCCGVRLLPAPGECPFWLSDLFRLSRYRFSS